MIVAGYSIETPEEAEQRYKCLGNGWTFDVITHILRYLSGKGRANDGI